MVHQDIPYMYCYLIAVGNNSVAKSAHVKPTQSYECCTSSYSGSSIFCPKNCEIWSGVILNDSFEQRIIGQRKPTIQMSAIPGSTQL